MHQLHFRAARPQGGQHRHDPQGPAAARDRHWSGPRGPRLGAPAPARTEPAGGDDCCMEAPLERRAAGGRRVSWRGMGGQGRWGITWPPAPIVRVERRPRR
ncbi:hypothetical protein DFI_18095 (plasmid) [Deinococcus ficus]|uniref:Uncharacterized protein n=1 Tax=Deinococcus ficus TaxID=317577 RepID=A0A221T2G2_9DEIO|nr:hypothetical protein DFI_18095 [Deinococcus ficus]